MPERLSEFVLTPSQADEAEGLLGVLADEQALSGERKPWGSLRGRRLVVWDLVDAADDLRRRADWLEEEAPGHGSNGGPRARSLRTLAGRIAEANA